MWNAWKERNMRIFKDKGLTISQLWELINRNLTETIAVVQWPAKDLQVHPRKQRSSEDGTWMST
jgi:hypothetical protein